MAPMKMESRLVLRYAKGQHTFRRFRADAADDNLRNLAKAINGFQDEHMTGLAKVTVTRF